MMILLHLRRSSVCLFLCASMFACGEENATAPIAPGTPSGPLGSVAPQQPGLPIPGVVPPVPIVPVPIPPGTPIPPPSFDPRTSPNGAVFGDIALAAGFVPDPFPVTGQSGGEVSAESFNAECRGYISEQPGHIFRTTSSFNSLRFLVNGGIVDTTLVVQTPSGQFLCDDDSEGSHPIVEGRSLQPGVYRIWVGTYMRGERGPYTLGISELPSVTTASLTLPGATGVTPPSVNAPSLSQIALSPGFMPDPNVVSGVSGGAQEAYALDPSCSGWVGQSPSHTFTANGHFPMLHVLVNAAGADTTLVIRRPDGTYLCNDDDNGLDPGLHAAFPPGVYQIFVGAYDRNERPAYRLGLSELSGVQPEQLGQPSPN